MGREIQRTPLSSDPIVKFSWRDGEHPCGKFDPKFINTAPVVGTFVKGVFVGMKIAKGSPIFTLKVEDGHEELLCIKKTATKGVYEPIEIGPKTQVVIFGAYSEKTGAPNQLTDKLSQVKPGEVVTIKYLGKQLNEKSGRAYNDFSVVVE